MVLTSSAALLLLSLNAAILHWFLLENIWFPCWPSLLPEHVIFVQVHAQRVPATYNCREQVPGCYNCREHVPACYNCRKHVLVSYSCREQVPLVITVETTFPQLITVGKNNGSSFFLRKRGTSEMSSMGHRNNAKINVSQNILVPFCSSKLVHFFNFFSEEFSFPISFENANFSE